MLATSFRFDTSAYGWKERHTEPDARHRGASGSIEMPGGGALGSERQGTWENDRRSEWISLNMLRGAHFMRIMLSSGFPGRNILGPEKLT
jgi:hypothetical protein